MSRTVIVTGANGGLGTYVTKKFLANGDTVIGASRKIEQSAFPEADFAAIPAEFSNAASAQKLVDQVLAKFQRIDVLVHTVGGFAGGTPLHATDEKTFTQMLDQNLTAAFHLVRAVVPHMRERGAGRFIAVGSHAAERAHANLGAYVVSKSALVTLIKTVALENVDRGITANLVLPGTMDTAANRAAMPKADATRWVSPADVAETIFWLASDATAQVSGAAIPVAGRDL